MTVITTKMKYFKVAKDGYLAKQLMDFIGQEEDFQNKKKCSLGILMQYYKGRKDRKKSEIVRILDVLVKAKLINEL